MDSRRTRVSCAASSRLFHRFARDRHALLGVDALLIQRAQLRVGVFEGAPRAGELGFDFEPARQRVVEAGSRSSTIGASPLASSCSRSAQRCCELRALLDHAREADG